MDMSRGGALWAAVVDLWSMMKKHPGPVDLAEAAAWDQITAEAARYLEAHEGQPLACKWCLAWLTQLEEDAART